jgi:hypothetical protein
MCETMVYAASRRDGSDILVKCGNYYTHGVVLCTPCEQRAKSKYPQGWDFYPGDRCKHGTYVGGCGRDWLCGACESGE